MKWTPEAENLIRKVPFFVRKKVRKKVEDYVEAQGKVRVEAHDIQAAKKQFLDNMASQIKGYQAEACFGASGCPHRANPSDALMDRIETCLESHDILGFLKQHVGNDLKYHHEFRVTTADCPNACSQPQIRDVGIIGARLPGLTHDPCSRCEACVKVCKENAITIDEQDDRPVINTNTCVLCGKCIDACPTGTLSEAGKGYRVQLGGRLGRHPRLAMELKGILTEDEVLDVLENVLKFYKTHSKNGERFSRLLTANDLDRIHRS